MAFGRSRTIKIEPPELGTTHGLAWARFAPPDAPIGSLIVIHGADSRKESHFDYARLARAAGWCALCFDVRGHGESTGELNAAVLDDLRALAALLPRDVPLALRGSSMGGYLAIAAAEPLEAAAIVAICPAPADQLVRGLRAGRFGFRVNASALEAFLSEHDDLQAISSYEGGVLLLHAEGDEVVPYTHSVALDGAADLADPKRLLLLPGGHHRSIQHDPELQAESLRFLAKAVGR
jgi:pimeloyl-ACP methyl ester carboxylesterase